MSIERFHSGPRMSQAVVHNGVVYVAGQVAAPGEDAAIQTRAILASIDRLLTEADTDKSRLLTATIWLADMADFSAMNAVWEDWVAPGDAPPRATVQARLARPEWKIEIVVTAALSAGWCTGVKRWGNSSGVKYFLYLTLPALPIVRRMQNGLLKIRLALPLSAV